MRFRDYGTMPPAPTGELNLISDVPGLRVGHHTLISDLPEVLRTGVTVLEIDSVHTEPVAAAAHVFNGYGKSMGLVQIEELGTMESHVYFTNTLSIGAVQQGAVGEVLRQRPATRSHNAVVMECNDSHLSAISALAVTPAMVSLALAEARRDFAIGSVGAGTGMVCFGFKGGIGSASRRLTVENQEFAVGAMVLSNFGQARDLRLPGMERSFAGAGESGRGSLIIVIATDLPLMPHQLRRVARHATMGIGLLGCPGHHGSGDIALAFSTGTRFGEGPLLRTAPIVADDAQLMSDIFRAAAWSAAEAILDSMFCSPTMKGLRGEVRSIREAMN